MVDDTQQPPDQIVLPNRRALTSASQENATIASMRWQNDPLFLEIYTLLGGYVQHVNDDGTVTLSKDGDPKMNEKGLKVILSFLRAYVNSSVALTNWSDEQAAELINQKLHQIHSHLMLKKKDYNIDDGDFDLIASIIDPIVFAQVNRAVSGWEGKNFHTTTEEHNVKNTSGDVRKPGFINRIVGGM